MTKKIIIGALIIMAFGTTSCKRSGTCSCEILGSTISTDYDDMDKEEYNDTKDNCESAGCDWSNKL